MESEYYLLLNIAEEAPTSQALDNSTMLDDTTRLWLSESLKQARSKEDSSQEYLPFLRTILEILIDEGS
jgi:hypothetical protein